MREQKKIEDTTTQAIEAVTNMVDIAVEAEIQYVADKFRQNTTLLYTVSSLFKSDALQALLGGRLRTLQGDGATDGTPQKGVQ